MNTLKGLGMEDPNQWKALKNNGTSHWETLRLPGGKAHSFDVRINSKNVNKSQVEYRQFLLGGTEKGLELKLKDIPVNLEKKSEEHQENVVEFFKDCSQFVHSPDLKSNPGVLESERVVNAHNEDDSGPFLVPYDSKFLSNLKTTITKYIPYQEDGTLRISRLKKIKRGEMPGKGSSKQGCIKINMTSLVRSLTEVQARHRKWLTLLKLPNGKNIGDGVGEFTSSVHLLGLKIPNDRESTNKTLVENMLSNANTQGNDLTESKRISSQTPGFFQVNPMRHLRTNLTKNTENKNKGFTQQNLKNASKLSSDGQRINATMVHNGSGSNVMKSFSSGNVGQMLNTKTSDQNVVKNAVSPTVKINNLKSVEQTNFTKQKETNALKLKLIKLLSYQGEAIRRRHYHHRRHHHRHHRNRFRKLHQVVSDDEQPEDEDFPTKIAGNSMGNDVMDDDDETPQLENDNFNGRVTTGLLHQHNSDLYSLGDLEQGKASAAGYERVQDRDKGQSLSEGIELKLDPDSYSPHLTYGGPSSNGMYSRKLGIPDLKPYLNNEFDKETNEVDDLSNRFNAADLVEANRLSRLTEDKIMRHAFGLSQEGHAMMGARQQDFPMITGNGPQTTQDEGEAEMFNERYPQGGARMANLQDQNPSLLNEAGSDTPLAWNSARQNPSMIYRNEPSMINSEELNLMNQDSRSFGDKQFPAMMSMYEGSRNVNGPLQMSNANDEMLMERGIERQRLETPGMANSMAMPPQTPQYPYRGNMFGVSPFAMEPQGPQPNAFTSPELSQADPFSPFQMGQGRQLAQAVPFGYAARKKKKKRSKTIHPRPSLQKKGKTTTPNRKKLN